MNKLNKGLRGSDRVGVMSNLKRDIEVAVAQHRTEVLDVLKVSMTESVDKDWVTKQTIRADKLTIDQIINLIESAIGGEPGKVIPYTPGMDNFATGYAHALRDIKSKLIGGSNGTE